jgi:hypothetical protein
LDLSKLLDDTVGHSLTEFASQPGDERYAFRALSTGVVAA